NWTTWPRGSGWTRSSSPSDLGRRDAELLHHPHRVEDAPVLAADPVVAETDDVDAVHVHALPGRRDAHELPGMRPRDPEVDGDSVAVYEELLRLEAQIRKAGPVHREELQHAFLRRLQPRRCLVFDEVVGQQLGEPVQVARVDQ